MMRTLFCCVAVFLVSTSLSGDSLPSSVQTFFESHCFECHAGEADSVEGDVNLEMTSIDWTGAGQTEFWMQVYGVVHANEMPPSDAASTPTTEQREELLKWLEDALTEHAPVGGTVPRRLNRVEYENTVRELFGLPEFTVPASFPTDDSEGGFDNVASGLILSAPLLGQYLEIATSVADEVLPPPVVLAAPDPREHAIPASGLGTNEGGGGALADQGFRLVSSRNMASAAGWTTPFEVPQSGVYRISLDAKVFQSTRMFYDERKEPFRLEVYARQNGEQQYDFFKDLRALATFQVPSEGGLPHSFQFETELFAGEVLGFRWADGPVFSAPGKKDISHTFIDDRLLNDREFYAAAIKLNGGKRGSTQVEFYEAIRRLIESGELDLNDPQLDKKPLVYGGGLSNAPHNWSKAYAYEQMHRFGPALDIVSVHVTGPSKVIPDQETRRRLSRSREFLARESETPLDLPFAEQFLRGFLPKVFRRPIEESQLEQYVSVVREHLAEHPKRRIEDGLHVAVRRALISPRFLFRGLKMGRLDDWDLASRLSYFITSGPPDARLLGLAKAGRLSDPTTLAAETRRLLRQPDRKEFVRHFTGQWLGTRTLKDIMPDPRLLRFGSADRKAMIAEAELFFEEMLMENHSLDHFIDPGFSYRNRFLNKIYGDALEHAEMRRVTFPKGGNEGGLLGLAAVLMATANGVDTHPVHRGVWLLENVFGQPTPPPPPEVPAVAPDTSGTTTMREQMLAHRADPACTRCHAKIDPLGFVMENFDPVGRWREFYPVYTEEASVPLKEEFYSSQGDGTRKGRRVDAASILSDGTHLNDVTDLKAYLIANPEWFAECLIEKLTVYGTGRSLNFGDKRIVRDLAAEVIRSKRGFQDILVAVVLSESFLVQ